MHVDADRLASRGYWPLRSHALILLPASLRNASASDARSNAIILRAASNCRTISTDRKPDKRGSAFFSSLETSRSAGAPLRETFFENKMPKQSALPSQLPPRLISREAAAAYVCVSPTIFDKLISEDRMPKPRKLTAHRKAWDVRELDLAIDNLPQEGETDGNVDFGWDK
jgi:predicted DNA-binding transcriptional regulator AlpA